MLPCGLIDILVKVRRRNVEWLRRRINCGMDREGGVSRSNEGGVRNRLWFGPVSTNQEGARNPRDSSELPTPPL